MDDRETEFKAILDRMRVDQERLRALLRGADPRPLVLSGAGFSDLAGSYLERLDPKAMPSEWDEDRYRFFGGPWIYPGEFFTRSSVITALFETEDGQHELHSAYPMEMPMSIERAAAIYAYRAMIEAASHGLVKACEDDLRTTKDGVR